MKSQIENCCKDPLRIADQAIYTFAAEKELDSLPNVTRSALIQHKREIVLVLESITPPLPSTLLSILNKHQIPQAKLVVIDKMPVDGRHNSKIDRVKLKTLIAKNKLSLISLMQSAA